MAHHDEEKRYASLDSHTDIDLENDHDDASETTLASDGFLSKHHHNSLAQIRHERSTRLATVLTWVRWGVVIFFQGVIIMLLLPTTGIMSELPSWGGAATGKLGTVKWTQDQTETGGDINGLYVPSRSCLAPRFDRTRD